ncbi:S-acyl fatty acid synthase thioesterase, medium chain [Aplysia californica]|uniref:oleoyl-[acyl-carrier-protein] hydrolase n=1 Tax=Aplysia californica TaxID=6500 RepID=A0ABM0JCD1_APLCA|nr:S-acyl fatty acid synthase thioesterase, medium chain [Aplysia californica]
MNCKHPRPYASKRMFCFPWAGGGASFYTALSEEITDELEVIALCLPGREQRFKDEGYNCLKELLDELVETIHDKYWDKPFIFFGHSMGALISFFLAVELKKVYNREPECMILSGTVAPNAPNVNESRLSPKNMTKDVFMSKLQELGGTPPEFLEHPELVDIYYPVMYADLILIQEMVYDHPAGAKAPLSCPIDFFDGEEDRDHRMDDWKKLTSGAISYRKMPGAHFFLKQPDNKKKLVSFINMRYSGFNDIV